MQKLSREEFDIMVLELTSEDGIKYDKMIEIAERYLKMPILKWSSIEKTFTGRDDKEDLRNEIYLKLIQKCIIGFFFKDDVLNNDPEGFIGWMYTLANNLRKDRLKRISKFSEKIICDIQDQIEEIPEPTYDAASQEHAVEKLSKSFNLVLTSNSQIYKVLTWMAKGIVVVSMDKSNREALAIIEEIYEKVTLDDMLEIVLQASKKIEWMEITEDKKCMLKEKMNKLTKDGKRIGSKKFSDFYMKKGRKESISDWISVVNKRIKEELQKK